MTAAERKRSGRPRERERERWAYVLLAQRPRSLFELSRRLGVSPVTAKRMIAALRARGYAIVSVRSRDGWRYEVRDFAAGKGWEADPFVRSAGFIEARGRAPRGKAEDADYDED